MASKLDKLKAQMGGNIGESMGAGRQGGVGGGAPSPPAAVDDWSVGTTRSGNTRNIDLRAIDADPTQPRKKFDKGELTSLAASLAEDKLIQAIVVRPGPAPGRFTIISGERRYRAAMMLLASGADDVETTIRAEVRTDLTAAKVKEIQVLENLLRSDLGPAEEAAAFREMMTAEGSQYPTAASLAAKLKVSEGTISRSLSLLSLPEWVWPLIVKKSPEHKGGAGGPQTPTMTPTQAYEVTKASPELQEELCRRVLDEGLTVAQIADIVAGRKEAARIRLAAVEDESPATTEPDAPIAPTGDDVVQGGKPEPTPKPKAARAKPAAAALRVFEPGGGLTITARRKGGIELGNLAAALEAALVEVRAEMATAEQTSASEPAAA